MGDNDFATGYALGADSNNNGNGMFGDGAWSWIWVILILALFGGWGNGGFGGFGGGSGLQSALTRQDLSEGFAMNNIARGISGIQQGICDSTYALNNSIMGGFHSNDLQLCQGFSGVNSAITNLGFNLQDCLTKFFKAIENFATSFGAVGSYA